MRQEDQVSLNRLNFRAAVDAELNYIQSLGLNKNLVLITSNLGAYEAILNVIGSDEGGMPVYQAVSNVKSRYSTQSGILARLKAMRQLGLLEERPGPKKSQVCLLPSETLLNDLMPILLKRHGEMG